MIKNKGTRKPLVFLFLVLVVLLLQNINLFIKFGTNFFLATFYSLVVTRNILSSRRFLLHVERQTRNFEHPAPLPWERGGQPPSPQPHLPITTSPSSLFLGEARLHLTATDQI